jgi:hypothetical protein
MQDLAGYEGRVLQIDNRVGNIVDLTETTDRMQFGQRVVGRRYAVTGALPARGDGQRQYQPGRRRNAEADAAKAPLRQVWWHDPASS